MDKATIDRMVQKRRDVLSIPYNRDPRFEYLKQFTLNYDMKTIINNLEEDFKEFYTGCYYLNHSQEASPEDIRSYVELFEKYFDESVYKIDSLQEFFEEVISYDDYNDIITFFEETDASKEKSIIKKMKDTDRYSISFITKMRMIKKDYIDDIENLVRCISVIKDHPDMLDIFTFLGEVHYFHCHKELFSTMEGIYSMVDPMGIDSKKARTAFIKKTLKTKEAVNIIVKRFAPIRDFVEGEELKEANYYKKNTEELNTLNNSMKLLDQSLEKEEILDARRILKGIRNQEIKLAVAQLIYDHNQMYYRSLEAKIDNLGKDSLTHYIAILRDNNINTSGIDVETITHNSLEETKMIIKTLRGLSFSDDMILYVLVYSSYSIVSEIVDYCSKKNIINREYLKSHLEMFNPSSNSFNVLKDNVSFLDENSINAEMFYGCLDLLFDDSGILKENITILKKYNLLNGIKTVNNLNFLLDKFMIYKIDMLIEFGYLDFLREDLGILNCDAYNRLYVLRMVDEKIGTVEQLISILDSNSSFYVPDELIYKYDSQPIIRGPKFKIPDYISLGNYRTSEISYSVNGVTISSPRVDRNINSGMTVGEAVSKGAYISPLEYQILKKAFRKK